MAQIRGYIAATLDGFIAEPDHGLGFLDPYPAQSAAYDAFYAGIGTLVMGRLTYEVVRRFGAWTYARRRSLVVTSQPISDLPPETDLWHSGVPALIAHLREDGAAAGDVWVVGGGRLQQAFLDADALDRLELFVLPVLLGGGIALFPAPLRPQTLRLVEAGRIGEMARLVYERPA